MKIHVRDSHAQSLQVCTSIMPLKTMQSSPPSSCQRNLPGFRTKLSLIGEIPQVAYTVMPKQEDRRWPMYISTSVAPAFDYFLHRLLIPGFNGSSSPFSFPAFSRWAADSHSDLVSTNGMCGPRTSCTCTTVPCASSHAHQTDLP